MYTPTQITYGFVAFDYLKTSIPLGLVMLLLNPPKTWLPEIINSPEPGLLGRFSCYSSTLMKKKVDNSHI